jgi:hypothetical protein
MQSSVFLGLCLLRGQQQSSVFTLMLVLVLKKGHLLRDWSPFGERLAPLVRIQILSDFNQHGDGRGTGRNWRM